MATAVIGHSTKDTLVPEPGLSMFVSMTSRGQPMTTSKTLDRRVARDRRVAGDRRGSASSGVACPSERDHELRAALFGIEASAVSLHRHRGLLESVQVDELFGGLVAEIRRLRLMTDGGTEAASAFDLGDAIAPAISCARASGLDVRYSPVSGVEVYGRRASAAQVLVALLDNVRRHAVSSHADVRVEVLDTAVDVFVADQGPGIPASLGRRVFDRGVTGDASSGSGLGLHVAHRLMTELGGSISLRACGDSGGTTIAVRFRRVVR